MASLLHTPDVQLEAIRMEELRQSLAQSEQRLASLPAQLESLAAQQKTKAEIAELKQKGTTIYHEALR
jgi:hypothetical protein